MADNREKFGDQRCCVHHGREHPPEELADETCNPDLPRKGRTSQDYPSENKLVHLDQTSSQGVPFGSCWGQHVNIYVLLLYSGYVSAMNTDLKIGQSFGH